MPEFGSRFSAVVGQALRHARREAGLTLRDVYELTEGEFPPSTVGGYERNERTITLARFCELAALYGQPADRLLGQILDRCNPAARREIVIDLNQLSLLESEAGHRMAAMVEELRARRGDRSQSVITLRSGDIEALALASRQNPRSLMAKIGPAIRRS